MTYKSYNKKSQMSIGMIRSERKQKYIYIWIRGIEFVK